MRAGTKQPYKSVRKGNKMIFSTITQNNLNLAADTTEIPAQYSNNIQFKFIQDNERFSGYIPTIYIGVYDSAMIECGDVISAGGAVVVDGDGVFAISNEIMYRNGFLAVGVTLTNNDENVSLKPVIYRIQASVGGLSPLPPDEGEWQQVVKAFVETLFNNWSAENLDPIKAQLEELISTAQTQQEKITSQQTQIDNAIGNMGDYEIVQEDPVQIRFKKGDGTFGETVDLGDGLASKAMVNAGYYTYKGISYGGSASNNGIDVAEIDGAYSQETTNGFQLFDASKLPTKSQGGATVTNNDDGSFTISGSGNLTSNYSNSIVLYSNEEAVKLFKQGTIYLKTEKATTPYFQLSFDGEGSFSLTNNGNSESIGTINQEMLEDVNFRVRLIVYGDSGSTITPATIKPMLYQDGDGTFEPFTGGIASPNPEYPQEPKFIGDYNEDTQKYDIGFVTSGKNLLNNEANTFSLKGVTFTINKDKSILLSGTATETIYWNDGKLSANLDNDKIYTLSGCPSGGGLSKYYMYLYNESFSLNDTGNGVTNMSKVTKKVVFGIAIFSGVNVDGLVFKPQLEIGTTATDYQPYQGFETTTVELNQPLRELPNGVKDTIENGVVTRRVGEITYDGSSDESWNLNGLYGEKYVRFSASAPNVTTSPYKVGNVICDKFPYRPYEDSSVSSDSEYIIAGSGYIYVLIEKSRLSESTAQGFKNWLQSNPITVWYQLATPTTEQITLPTLPSWYPYTNAWVETELQPSFVEWHIKTAGANQNDLTVIKEDISQLQTETTQLNDDVTRLMGAFTSVTDLTKQLFLLMHRVGDIIFSTSDENPSTIYGGTWVAWGKGQVPVGVDASDSDFNTVEKTGGEKEHTLTVDEMPSHKHDFGQQFTGMPASSGNYGYYMIAGTQTDVIKNTGGNQPHNNLQPYITCYMWKRIA